MNLAQFESVVGFECCHADTCLSDYWSGHHLPHVSIIVWRGMTLDQIKNAIESELNQGAIAGSWNYEIIESDRFYEMAKNAVEAITPVNESQKTFFNDMEDTDDQDISIFAYFVFVPMGE